MYIAIADRAGAAVSAFSSDTMIFNKVSRNDLPIVSISPTKMAAKNAPLIEPIPPIMITTNATIIISFPFQY